MKKKYALLVMVLFLFGISCSKTSESITGTVVDADTEKPLEGAVVLAEWTTTKGFPGQSYEKVYKVVEAVTDQEGKFKISGILNPLVNPPTLVIYKKGYVAWRNDYIFPSYEKRENFQWKDKYVFRVEHFKKSYSHSRHILFFSGDLSLNSSSKLLQAYSWEDEFASKEEELLRKKRRTKKLGEYTEEDIWKEIVEDLYFQNKGNKSE